MALMTPVGDAKKDHRQQVHTRQNPQQSNPSSTLLFALTICLTTMGWPRVLCPSRLFPMTEVKFFISK